MTRRIIVVGLFLVALVAGACGANDDPTVGGSAPEHNDADVRFAQGMIPHHEQAIEMSDLALRRGESGDVKALAEAIRAAQGPEITTMRGWLESWGEEEPDEAHGGGHSDDDSGMMSEDEMRELQDASGADLDRMFLEMMIRHHEGAIDMARAEVEDGAYEEAKAMARTIIEAQQAEIEEMESLLVRP